MEWLGIEVRNMPCFPLISACHQVVNVYKHGDGDAHQKLVNAHPGTTQYGNAKVIRKRDQLATKNLKFPRNSLENLPRR